MIIGMSACDEALVFGHSFVVRCPEAQLLQLNNAHISLNSQLLHGAHFTLIFSSQYVCSYTKQTHSKESLFF